MQLAKPRTKRQEIFIVHIVFTALLCLIVFCVWALAFYYLDAFRKMHTDQSRTDLRTWLAMAVAATTGTFIYIGATLRFYYEGGE